MRTRSPAFGSILYIFLGIRPISDYLAIKIIALLPAIMHSNLCRPLWSGI